MWVCVFEIVWVLCDGSCDNLRSMVGLDGVTYAGNNGLEVQHPDGSKSIYPLPAQYEDNVRALLEVTDFAAARQWCVDHPDVANGYLFSKQCIIYYAKALAVRLVSREIRVNTISPCPTDTPMLPDFHAQAGKEFLEEHFLAPVGRNATPEDMAGPLLFLGSRLAGFVSGQDLTVDYGYKAAVETGAKVGLL